MKFTRFLPFTLTLLLTACGGNGPTPPTPPVAPPTEPAPTPITPVPIPTPPPTPTPTPPTSDVPYYGEWRVIFTADSGVGFTHTLNITETAPGPLINGGYGLQHLCIGDGADPCEGQPNYASGFGFIGNLPLDNGTTPLSLAISTQYDASDDPELKIFSVEDMSLTTDSQGRQVLRGDAAWLYHSNTSDDGTTGTIVATNIGAPLILTSTQTPSVNSLSKEYKQFRLNR